MNIICYLSLAVWDIPIGWKWACFILCGAGFGLSGLCMAYVCHYFLSVFTEGKKKLTGISWAHEICSDDNEERALTVGSMNEMAYVFQAWLPQVVWQQVDAPQYQKGYITVTVFSVVLIITAFAIRALERVENSKKYADLFPPHYLLLLAY